MRIGRLVKTETGWWVKYLDYKKNADGTAHGKPIEVSLEVETAQTAKLETLALGDSQVEFEEVLLQKDPEAGWTEIKPSKKRGELPVQKFARLSFKSQAQIDSEFLETLREFAWEMWKAGAIAEDQRRESFDQFYSDFSDSTQVN